MTDPVARSDELDRRIIAIPEDRVFRKSTVVVGFLVLVLILAIGFGSAFLSLRDVTTSTNEAVRLEVPGLQQQIKDRDRTIAEQQDVLNQATDAIVLLIGILEENGIDAPEITIRPSEE